MKTLFNLLILIAIIVAKPIAIIAQENQLIIDDQIYNDKIECYNFKKIQVSFPITESMFTNDVIVFRLKVSNFDTIPKDYFLYLLQLSKKDFKKNFAGKKTGVLTLLDENREVQTPFVDVMGPLLKQEFYKIGSNKELLFKPILFEVVGVDITSYEMIYDENTNTTTREPVYSDGKVLNRYKIRFYNIINNFPIRRKDQKMDIKDFAKTKSKEKKEQEDKLLSCPMSKGSPVKVIMNTSVNLDTFYGYIE